MAAPVAVFPVVLRWRLEAGLRTAVHARAVSIGYTGGPVAFSRGRFASLHLRLRRAALDGLTVDDFRGDFTDVTADAQALWRGDLVVRHIGGGHATLTLREEDLARYLLDRRGIRSPVVRLANGIVTLGGQVNVLNTQLDVRLQGRLSIVDGRRVVLDAQTLSIGGLELPSEIAGAVVAAVNPLMTVENFPLPLKLVDVTVDGGAIVLTAAPSS